MPQRRPRSPRWTICVLILTFCLLPALPRAQGVTVPTQSEFLALQQLAQQLQQAIGALAARVGVLETATPPPPPPPPPPPTIQPSPNGTFGSSVIDGELRVWTLGAEGIWGNAGNFQVLRDGQPVPTPLYGLTGDAFATALLYLDGRVFGTDKGGGWFLLTPAGNTGVLQGDPRVIPYNAPPASGGGGTAPPPAPLPAPSPNASPNGTLVEGPGASVTDYYGKVWALRAISTPDDYKGSDFIGYAVSEDGIFAADPPHAIKLAVFHTPVPAVWMFSNNGYWYRVGVPNNWPISVELDPFAPPVVLPEPTVGGRRLIGGWRFPQGWGNLAMAFDGTNRLWLSATYENPGDIREFRLPPMGTGSDPSQWPLVQPTRSIPPWWQNGSNTDFANGLFYGSLRGGPAKLWVAPFTSYDTVTSPTTILYAEDGEQIQLPLPRQKFAGFVKRGPGLEPYIGAGGYASGQGTSSGPTLAQLDGTRLIEHGWPDLPGPDGPDGVPVNWNQRAPRDPNYAPIWGRDDWTAWNPREINGALQGRWASDRIWAGGLVLPEGVTYWPRMGTGVIGYVLQNFTFGAPPGDRTYRYLYDRTTYQFNRYELTGLGEVRGQELGPDGTVYLTISGESLVVAVFAN